MSTDQSARAFAWQSLGGQVLELLREAWLLLLGARGRAGQGQAGCGLLGAGLTDMSRRAFWGGCVCLPPLPSGLPSASPAKKKGMKQRGDERTVEQPTMEATKPMLHLGDSWTQCSLRHDDREATWGWAFERDGGQSIFLLE